MKCLVNGKIRNLDKMAIDTGYFYGFGVFETILIREGVPMFLGDHLDRLNQSLSQLGINKSVTKEDVDYAISAFRCHNIALKINVSESAVVITTRQVTYTRDHYQEGLKLTISDVLINPTSPLTYMKTMNYMDNIMVLQKAKKSGFHDAIFLNPEGDVCETAIANIFMIKEGCLYTPKTSSGLLEGVVRKWIIENFDVTVKVLKLDDFKTCDGVFVTNSLLGIMKVSDLDGVQIVEAPLIQKITASYVKALKHQGEVYE